MDCYYCKPISHAEPSYPVRKATHDLGSLAPRCALHWRYVCGVCAESAHFMSTAYCPKEKRYFCGDCANGTQEVEGRFYVWDYYFQYRSPWTDQWEPALDRLEYERRHPQVIHALARGTAAAKAASQRWAIDEKLDSEAVRDSWNRNATRWDHGFDADGDESRKYHSDELVLKLLGQIAGQDVLDLGSGNGYLCRKLARVGARVTGVELSDRMIAVGERREHAEPLGVRYLTTSATDLSMIKDASFDAIVSSYVLMSIPDFTDALAEAGRVLRPKGRFIVLISHPCFSCGPRRWEADAPDTPRPEEFSAFSVDHYFRSGPYLLDDWVGFSPIPYFHRPLREYWQAFKVAGFEVDEFDEPSISERGLAEFPPWKSRQAQRIPFSCVFRLVKRSTQETRIQRRRLVSRREWNRCDG